MTLLRTFGRLDNHGGIALGRNLVMQMGLKPGSLVNVRVIRITGSMRVPFITVCRLDRDPRSTALETVIFESPCRLDEECNIVLDDEVIAEAGFAPGLSLELKLTGPTNAPWVAIRNKGRARLTTLQEKMRRDRKTSKRNPMAG